MNLNLAKGLFAGISAFLVFSTDAPAQKKSDPNQVHMPMKVLGNILKFYAEEENEKKYPERVEQLIEAEYLTQLEIDKCKDLYYVGKGRSTSIVIPAEKKVGREVVLAIAMNEDGTYYTVAYIDSSVKTFKNEKGFKTSEEVYKSFK